MRIKLKKIGSVAIATVYLHVNVLCAGQLGAPAQLTSGAESLWRSIATARQIFQRPDPVFSFHADPLPIPRPVDPRPADDPERPAPAPVAPAAERLNRVNGIQNEPIRDALTAQLAGRPLDQLTVRDLVAAGLVPPAKQQELTAAGLMDQRVTAVIQIFGGQLEFRINKPDAVFSVNVNLAAGQTDLSKADTSITRTARANPAAAPADRPAGPYNFDLALNRALGARTPDGGPALRRLPNGEFVGRVQTLAGGRMETRSVVFRRDGETLVPVALLGPGGARQAITQDDLVFRGYVSDRVVDFGIHHMEIGQDGALIVHASGGLRVGQIVFDGNMNEGAGAGGANGRPQPRTGQGNDQAVGGYDIGVANNGQIMLTGREPNARFAFTFGVQSGFASSSVTPLTALASNVRILDSENNVVARSGDLGQIQGASGAVYQFSTWSVTPNLPAGGAGERIVRHFGVSPESSSLIGPDGRVGAGRVERGADGSVTRLVFGSGQAGQQAARDIFTNNPAAFQAGGPLAGVSAAMEGPAGRASIQLSAGADPARVAGALRRMESFNANGKTGAQIDAFFRDISATPGVARYQMAATIQHLGRPVMLMISGRGAINGNVAAPNVTSDHPPVLAALYGGTPRAMAAPGHLTDVGLGIDAEVTDSSVQHRFNPATGRNEFSGNGDIHFRTADGVTGTARVEGGEVQSVRFQGGAAGGNLNFAPGPGEPPVVRLRVAAGSDQTFDRRTGELTGNLGAGLQVQDVRRGLTVNLTNGAPGRIDAAMVGGNNLQAFGQNVQVTRVALENGSLRMDLAAPVNVNGDIRLGDVAANPAARVNNAAINTVSIDVFPGMVTGNSGALTGYGRSRIDGQEVYVPDGGVGGRGISAGGDSANLRVRRADDGKGNVVRAAGAGETLPGVDPTAYLNVQIQETRAPAGFYQGQATIQTAGARNLVTEGAGVRLGDRTYNGRVRIDNLPAGLSPPGESVQTVTALEDGAGFTRDNGDSTTIRTPLGVPQTLTYVNGQLRALAGDTTLTNVTMVVNGAEFTFEMIPGAPRPDGTRPQIAAPRLISANLDVLGTAVPRADVRDVRLEEGKIVVDLVRPVARTVNGAQARADRADGTTEVAGPNVNNQQVRISRITLDPASGNVSYRGEMAVTGETRVVRGDRPQRPDGRVPPPADPDRQPSVPDSEAVASRNVEFEDQADGTSIVRPTPGATDARVGVMLTVSRDGRNTKPPAFQVIGTTDFSRNVGTFGNGANLLGTHWSAGATVDVGVVADGNYNVKTPTGAIGTRRIIKDGQEKIETIESEGGVIPVRGGNIVARGRGSPSGSLEAVRGLDATTPTGRHTISGALTENPEAVARGLRRDGADRNGQVVIRDGVVESVSGVRYTNPNARGRTGDVLFETNDGKPGVTNPSFTVIEGGTTFVDSGLLSLGNARFDVTSRVGVGGIRMETRIREDVVGGPAVARGRVRVDEFQVNRIDAARGGTTFGTFHESRQHNGDPQGGMLVGGSTPLEIIGPGVHLRLNQRERNFEMVGTDGRVSKTGSFQFRGIGYELRVRPGERGERDSSVFVANRADMRALSGNADAIVIDTNGTAHRGTITEVAAVRTGPMEERRSAYFHIDLDRAEIFHAGEDGDGIAIRAVKIGLVAAGQPDRNITMFDYAVRYQDQAPHRGGEHHIGFLVQDHRGLRFVESLGTTPGRTLTAGRIGWYDGAMLHQVLDGSRFRIQTVFSSRTAAAGSAFAADERGLRAAVTTRTTELAAARTALEANPTDRALLRLVDTAESNLRDATGELDGRQLAVTRLAINDDRIRIGVVMYMPEGSVDLRQGNSYAREVGGERIGISRNSLITIREGEGDKTRYSLTHSQRSPSGRFQILSSSELTRRYRDNEFTLNGVLRAQGGSDAIRIGETNDWGDYISLTRRERGGGGDMGPKTRQPAPERVYIRRSGNAVEVTRGDVVVQDNSLGIREGTILINESMPLRSLRRYTVATRENNEDRGYAASATIIGGVSQDENGNYNAEAVRTGMERRFPKGAEFNYNELTERTTVTREHDGTEKESKGRSIVILDQSLRTVGVAGISEERASYFSNWQIRNVFNVTMVINQDPNNPANAVQIRQNDDRKGFSANESHVVEGNETTRDTRDRTYVDADGNRVAYNRVRVRVDQLYWRKADGSLVPQDQSEATRITIVDRDGNARLGATGRPITFTIYTNNLAAYAAAERMANGDEDKLKQIRENRDAFVADLAALGTGREPHWANGDIIHYLTRSKPASIYGAYAKPELTMGLAYFAAFFGNVENTAAIRNMKAYQTDLDDIMAGKINAVEGFGRVGQRMADRKWELIVAALLPFDTLAGCDFKNKPWESVGRVLLFAAEIFATVFSGGTYAAAKGGWVATKVAIVVSKIAAISRALGVTKLIATVAKYTGLTWTLSKIGAMYRGYQSFQRGSVALSATAKVLGTVGEYVGRRMFVNSVSNYMAVGGEKGYNSTQAWTAFRQVLVSLVTYQAFNILKAGGQLFSAVASFNGGLKIATALSKLGAFGAQAIPTVAAILNFAGKAGSVFVLGGLVAEANRALGGGPNAPGFFQGGAIAVAALLGFSALSRLGNATIQLVGNIVFGGGKSAQVYLEAFSVSLAKLGKAFSDAHGVAAVSVGLKYVGMASVSLLTRAASFLMKWAGTGALTMVLFNGTKNVNSSGKWGDFFNNVGKSAAQGAFLGVLVGGAATAMSKWADTAGKSTNAGRLAFESERMGAAVGMGVWEVAFNSMEFKASTWWNPMTWMSGISQLLEGAGILGKSPGEEQHSGIFDKLASKFYGTFNNIFVMHPFFAFGRVGTGPAGLLGAAAGKIGGWAIKLNERALTGGGSFLLNKTGAVVLRLTALSIEKGLVMPVTIKTFELFEHQAVNIAQSGPIGLLNETKADGKDKGERIEVLFGMTRNEIATTVIKYLGFINTPIHAPHSAKEMIVQKRLGGAREGVMDFLNPFAAARMERGRELGASLLEGRRAGGEHLFVMADGFKVRLSGEEIKNLQQAAFSALLTPELRRVLADPANRSAVAAVFDNEGKFDRLVHNESSEITVTHDGKGNFSYKGADGVERKAESESDGKGGFTVRIELPGTSVGSGATYRINFDKTGKVTGEMTSGERSGRGERLVLTLEVSNTKGDRTLNREVEVQSDKTLNDQTSGKELKTDERLGAGDVVTSLKVERKSGKSAGEDADTVGRDQLERSTESEARPENPAENRSPLEDVVRETGPPEADLPGAGKLPTMDKVAADLSGKLTDRTAIDALERAAKNPGSKEATLLRSLFAAVGAERTADILNLFGMTKQSMTFLTAVVEGGAAGKLSEIIKDPKAAGNLRDLVKSGLSLPAAKLLGELVVAARPEAMQSFLRQLSRQGIEVFRDLLNTVSQDREASRALTAMFSALDKTGGARFATMMNTLGTLDPAARANAIKNMTTFLSKVGPEGAKRFAEVLNQATRATAQALAHMFAEMTAKGAENLATIMKSMSRTEGFANFLNTLSAGKPPAAIGKLLAEVFNNLSEKQSQNLGQMFSKFDAKGGQNFADMVKSLMGTNKAPMTEAVRRLFDTVTRLEAKGREAFAALLNKVTDKKVVEGLAKLLSDLKDDTRQGFVNLLEQAGKDGGATLAAILQKTGEKGVNGLGEILQNNKAAEGLGRLLAQMPATSRAADLVANMLVGPQVTALMRALETFGGQATHAELLVRILDTAAGKGVTAVQFAEIVGRLKAQSAGRQAAEILADVLRVKGETSTLEDGGKMGDELLKLANGDAPLLAEMMLHTTETAAKDRSADKAEEFGESLVEKVLGDKGLSASQRKELIDALEKTDLGRFLTELNRQDPNVREARQALGLAEGETLLVLTPEFMDFALFSHISSMSNGELDKYLKDTIGRLGEGEHLQARRSELESQIKELEAKKSPTADESDAVDKAKSELRKVNSDLRRLAPEKDFNLKAAAIAMQARWGGNAGQAFAVASQFATTDYLRKIAAEYKRLVRVEGDGTLGGVRVTLRAEGSQVRAEIRDANKGLLKDGQAVDIQVTDSFDRSGIAVADIAGRDVLAGLKTKFPAGDNGTPASKALEAAEATGLFGADKMSVLISGNGVEVISGRGRSESALFIGRDGSFAVRTRNAAVIGALVGAGLIGTLEGNFIVNQMKRGLRGSEAELVFRFKVRERAKEGGTPDEKVKTVVGDLEDASFSHGGATLGNFRHTQRQKAQAEAGVRDGSSVFAPGDKAAGDATKLGGAKGDSDVENKQRSDASSKLKAEEERRSEDEKWSGNPAAEARFEDQLFNALNGDLNPADLPAARRLIATLENSGSSLQGRVARRLALELILRVGGTRADRAALIADLFRSATESFFSFMRNVPDSSLAEGFAVERLVGAFEGALAGGRIPVSRAEFLATLREAHQSLVKEGRGADAALMMRFIARVDGTAPAKADLKKEADFQKAWSSYHEKVGQLLEAGWSMKEISAIHGSVRSLLTGERAAGNLTLRALGQEIIASLGAGASLDRVEARLAEAEERLSKTPADNAGQVRDQIAGLRALIGRVRNRLSEGGVDALFRLGELSRSAEVVETMVGSKIMDRESLENFRREIGEIKDPGARAAMDDLIKLVEEHVRDYDAKAPDSREKTLDKIGEAFERLLESYGMNVGREEIETLLNNDLDTTPRGEVLTRLFNPGGRNKDFNPNKLDIGQRLALVLATSAQHFGVKKGDAIFRSSGRVENGKRGALLFQFIVGRVAGLEAGGGKTAVFIQGIAMDVMRRQARGDPMTFTAELVAYANGEVSKYVSFSPGGYGRLFRALGLEVRDGRFGNNEEGRRNEEAAYDGATVNGRVKVVISDMNTRGFRQNSVERDPGSVLALRMKKNVLIKAMDEVDAQILSRMAFINSDTPHVASAEVLGRGRAIESAIMEVFGSKEGGNPHLQDYVEGKTVGYRDFKGEAVSDLSRGLWYTKIGEGISVSEPLMKAVMDSLKKNGKADVTSGEVYEFFRAMVSVRSMETIPGESKEAIFGFTDGAKDGAAKEEFLRPTHKKAGEFQFGQIDSSAAFNVAAVLLYRRQLASSHGALVEGRGRVQNMSTEEMDSLVSVNDIRLSKASASATLIQALQGGRNIHRFGATGTPDALNGIIQATLGIELTQVFSSSYADFNRDTVKSVKAAFDAAPKDGPRGGVWSESTRMRTSFLEVNGQGDKATQAARAIDLSEAYGDGILIGARSESDLIATFASALKNNSASGRLIERVSRAGSIREAVDIARRALLTEQMPQFAGDRTNGALLDHVRRTEVLDGNGGKDGSRWSDGKATRDGEAVAGAAAPERLIIYSTEIGLRGFSFNAERGKDSTQRVNAVFMGLEMMSSESRMQAWKRVDRTKRDAVRIELVETGILKNRVEHAQEVDSAMRQRFGRPDGLFFRDTDKAFRTILGKDVENMSHDELVQLASKLSSLENLGQSAMFFINEQIESKLLKEPLTAWKAREEASGNEAGRQELAKIQVQILEHSDRRDHKSGTEMMDPRRQALDAFRSSSQNVIQRLTQVAKNEKVSQQVRVEAVERIADIILAERGLAERLFKGTDASGTHSGARYQSAAFVNVAADSRSRPAEAVVDTVVRLADLLLPTTRTSMEVSGAKGGQATTDLSAGTPRGPTGPAAAPAGPSAGRRAMPVFVTYAAQAVSAALSLGNMTQDDKDKFLTRLGIAPAPGRTDRDLAIQIAKAWVQNGGTAENFNMESFTAAVNRLGGLLGDGNVNLQDAVRIAVSKNSEEETVRAVASMPGSGPTQIWARGVLADIDARRETQARAQAIPSGAPISMVLGYVRLIGGALLDRLTGTTAAQAPIGALLAGTTNSSRRQEMARAALDILGGLPKDRMSRQPALNDDQRGAARSMMDRLFAVAAVAPSTVGGLDRISFADVIDAAGSKDGQKQFLSMIGARERTVLGIRIPPVVAKVAGVGAKVGGMAALGLAFMGMPALALGAVGLAAIGTFLSYDASKPDPLAALTDKFPSVATLFGKPGTFRFVATMTALTVGLPLLGMTLAPFLPAAVLSYLPTTINPALAALAPATWLVGKLADQSDRVAPSPLSSVARLTRTALAASEKRDDVARAAAKADMKESGKDFSDDPRVADLVEDRIFQSKGGGKGVTVRDVLNAMPTGLTDDERDERIAAALILLAPGAAGRSDRAKALATMFRSEGEAKNAALDQVANLEIEPLLKGDQDISTLEAIARFEAEREGKTIGLEEIEAAFPATVQGGRRPTSAAVISFYAGQASVSDEDMTALRSLDRTERSLRTPTAGNILKKQWEALQDGSVHERLASLLPETLSPAALQAAQSVVSAQSDALNAVTAVLENAGMSREDIGRFRSTVYSASETRGKVASAVNALPLSGNEQAHVLRLLDNVYFGASSLGFAAVRAGGQIGEDEAKVVAAVLNPGGSKAGGNLLANWNAELVPFSVAAPIRMTGFPVLTPTGTNGWTLSSVPTSPYQAIRPLARLDFDGGRLVVRPARPVAADQSWNIAWTPTPGAAPTIEVTVGADRVALVPDSAGHNVPLVPGLVLPAGTTIVIAPKGAVDRPELTYALPLAATFNPVTRPPSAPLSDDETETPTATDVNTTPLDVTPPSSSAAEEKDERKPVVPVVASPQDEVAPAVADQSNPVRPPENTPATDAVQPKPDVRPADPVSQKRDGVLAALEEVFINLNGKNDFQDLLDQLNGLLTPAFMADHGALPPSRGDANLVIFRNDRGVISTVFVRDPQTNSWNVITPEKPAATPAELPTDLSRADQFSWSNAPIDRHLEIVAHAASTPVAQETAAAAPRENGWARSIWNALVGFLPGRRSVTAGVVVGLMLGVTGMVQASGGGQVVSQVIDLTAFMTGFVVTAGTTALLGAGLRGLRALAGDAVGPAAPTTAERSPASSISPLRYELPDGNPALFRVNAAVTGAAARMAGMPTERIAVLPLAAPALGQNGEIAYEPTDARILRTLTFRGAPAQGTASLRALARKLDFGSEPPQPGRSNDRAAEAVGALLAPDSGFADWMNLIEVGPLLSSLSGAAKEAFRQDPDFANAFAWLAVNPDATLGDVQGRGVEKFNRFVYALVAFNAESISTRESVMITGRTYERLAGDGPVALMHSHLGGTERRASVADRFTAKAIQEHEAQAGLAGPGLMLVSDAEGRVIGFNAVKETLLTEKVAAIKDAPPVAPPYQSLDVTFLSGTNEVNSALARLSIWMRGWFGKKAVPEVPLFDLSKPGDRAAANFLVDQIWTMVHDSKVEVGTIRTVFNISLAVAANRISEGDIDGYLAGRENAGLNLKQIVLQLSNQMRASTGLMYAGSTGQLGGVVRTLHTTMTELDHYGVISALPAQERGWILNQLGAIQLNLVDAKEAARRANALENSLKGRDVLKEIVEPLRTLAGIDGLDFYLKLNKARRGTGFVGDSDLKKMLEAEGEGLGSEERRETLEVMMKLLMPAFARVVAKAAGAEGWDAHLADLQISVVYADGKAGSLSAGTATYDAKRNQIVLALDAGWDMKTSLVRCVGLFTHELTHPYADKALAELQGSPFGIPTMAEEAWVQSTASRALKEMGLGFVAAVMDAETNRAIVRQEEAQAVYLMFEHSPENQDAFRRSVLAAQDIGQGHSVVVVAPRADLVAALNLFADTQVRVIPLEGLSSLAPLKGETPLEAHSRLFLGTTRVRFAVSEGLRSQILSGGSALAAALRAAITRLGANAPDFELLAPVEKGLLAIITNPIISRVLASQA